MTRSCILVGVLALGASFAPFAGAAPPVPCSPAADALLAAEQTKAATDAYVKALTAQPQLRCATRRLKAIAAKTKADASSSAKDGCTRAADLAGVGKRKEAEAKYVEILKSRDEECARSGLEELRADPSWIEDLRDWMAPIASALALGAILLLGGLAILGALFVAMTYWSWTRHRLSRTPFIRWAFRPRVGVTAFTDAGVTPPIGSGVTGLVRMHLRRLARRQEQGGSDYRLDRITGTEGIATAVGRLAGLAPQFKALSALLAVIPQLARLPRYTVNGALQNGTVSAGGAGLTVILDEQHMQGEGVTLWSHTSNIDGPAYQSLAAGAAGWTDFLIRQREGFERPSYTTSAESYAYLRTGVQLEAEGREGEARSAYMSAVKVDPANVGALLNLSVAAAREGQFADAITWLEIAQSVLEAA